MSSKNNKKKNTTSKEVLKKEELKPIEKKEETKENTKEEKIKKDNVEKKVDSSTNNKDTKTSKKADDNKKQEKSKAEELVFKDSKKEPKKDAEDKKTKNEKNKEQAPSKKENKVVSEVKKEEPKKKIEKKQKDKEEKIKEKELEENENKKRKVIFRTILLIVILMTLLCFCTIFAVFGTFKQTIARGVKINGVDLSNLTYEEAKEKISDAMTIKLLPNIDIVYGDYKYTLNLENIEYKYNISEAVENAYNVGKKGNIIENNFSLLKSAIFGEDINITGTYDEEALEAIIDIIDTNIPGRVKQYSYYIDGENLIINPGTDGIQVQTEELHNKIISSIENRNYKDIMNNYENIIIEIPYKDVIADKIDAKKVSESIYTEPQDAYYVAGTETEEAQIYPAVDGISFGISVEEAQTIIDSEVKTEYAIPLTITKAAVQLKDIGIEAFPHKIETFSTRYDASNVNRSKNLGIAASKINGTVLMPGDVFSFNGVVGERTVAEGYENAAIYSNGQVVDGLAGGICQISSTLYNVAVLSNLEIVERHNHSFTTSYVVAGRDATVVYGIKDLKFKNSRNYPIKIEASVATGIVTFSIYGMKEAEEYSVKIIPVTTQTMPYPTQTIEDSSLAAGTMKIIQPGASGCKVTTYKELYLNKVLMSREVISNDVYQTMTRIVKVPKPVVEVTPEVTNPVQ